MKLAAACADEVAARKRWAGRYRKVLVRLASLRAAETLADMEMVPGRLHALTGDRKDQFALYLWGSVRLVFAADDDPLPVLEDGGLDRKRVTKIKVVEVVDYHGN